MRIWFYIRQFEVIEGYRERVNIGGGLVSGLCRV